MVFGITDPTVKSPSFLESQVYSPLLGRQLPTREGQLPPRHGDVLADDDHLTNAPLHRFLLELAAKERESVGCSARTPPAVRARIYGLSLILSCHFLRILQERVLKQALVSWRCGVLTKG